MNLVIVESPAKAKTINKYLGTNYTVLASYGHIRDLPSKNGSVDPEDKFKMIWEVDSFSKKYLKEITDVAKESSKIILATDPDREGEAIAWHVKEYLHENKLLKGKKIESCIKGSSWIQVNKKGYISHHHDYWDSVELFQTFKLLRFPLKFIKTIFSKAQVR